jgi:hypothetical protein
MQVINKQCVNILQHIIPETKKYAVSWCKLKSFTQHYESSAQNKCCI